MYWEFYNHFKLDLSSDEHGTIEGSRGPSEPSLRLPGTSLTPFGPIMATMKSLPSLPRPFTDIPVTSNNLFTPFLLGPFQNGEVGSLRDTRVFPAPVFSPTPNREFQSSEDLPNPLQDLSNPLQSQPSVMDAAARVQRKRAELETLQAFVHESKFLREQVSPVIYDSATYRDIPMGVTRTSLGAFLQESHRSLSQTQGVENVAELRRNIAEKYSSKATGNTSSQRTDRIISGVFVSYPQRRDENPTPASEQSPDPLQDGMISQFRQAATGKMSAEEYLALRKNLLSRSEQHAVSN